MTPVRELLRVQRRSVYTELEATAYHEAGHTVMAYLKSIRIVRVSIVADEREGSLGHLLYSGKLGEEAAQGLTDVVRKRLLGQIQTAMGGLTAEYLFTGKRNISGAAGDLAIIESILPVLERTPESAAALSSELWKQTETELNVVRSWKMLHALAEYLLDRRPTLSGKDALEIVKAADPEATEEQIDELHGLLNREQG